MKNKILEKFPKKRVDTHNCTRIYIADFTERTESERGVEVSYNMPKCPKNPINDMDVMKIHNNLGLDVIFATFDDNSFKNAEGNDEAHSEGAFFIDGEEESFFALYEIKDCKPTRISTYKQEIKNKIKCSSRIMRSNGIVPEKKIILGLVTFPRKNKGSFKDYFNNDYLEMKRILKENKINFFCSNNFNIKNSSNCNPLYE